MRIIAHPVNIEALRCQIKRSDIVLDNLELIANEMIPRDRPTGKYQLPTGELVEAGMVFVRTRFFQYGPEDLEYLLFAGIVSEEREMVFYQLDDRWLNKMSCDLIPRPLFWCN